MGLTRIVTFDATEDVLEAFGADGQCGTKLACVPKPERLNARCVEQVLAAIAQHPGFGTADMILN